MIRKIFNVGVVVMVKREGKILLGKRLGTVGNGQWGLPGGHLKVGESLAAGARRELKEETGLEAEDLELINITNDPREGKDHWIHIVFLAKGITKEPRNLEPEKCGGWGWFNLDVLPHPIFYGHQKLLDALVNKNLLSD